MVKEDRKIFDETFKDYMQFQKRAPAATVNAKLYFIALESMRQTKAADKGEIHAVLSAPSTKYPKRTLAEILVLRRLSRNRTKSGRIRGVKSAADLAEKLPELAAKFTRGRESRTQFLRSGWFPALKKLNFWNRKSEESFPTKQAGRPPAGVRVIGSDKGDVTPAKLESVMARGTIFNFVGRGKQASRTVEGILADGLAKGVRKEIASMKDYIDKAWRKQMEKMKRRSNGGIK